MLIQSHILPNNIKKSVNTMLVASAILTGVAACTEKKPYVQMPKENVPEAVYNKLDSLSKESKKIINNPEYELYGKDTLELSKNFARKTDKFVNKMNDKAKMADEETVVGSRVTINYYSPGPKYQIEDIYDSNHTNHIGVIRAPKVLTTDSTDMYVPVEYYGMKNPNVDE